MRTLISTAFISLDGVVEGPGGEPGYRNSGWTFKEVEFDPEAFEIKGREQEEATAILMGRVSYEAFSPVWPNMKEFAGYKPRGTESFTGVSYSTTELRIRANLNGYLSDAQGGNATINDSSDEHVVYTFDSANKQIKRAYGAVGATPEVIASNIESFTFGYLDSSGAATTTPANIRQVSLDITARTSKPDPNLTTNNGYRTYDISTVITPTNLAY